MRTTVLALLCLLPAALSAITIEVVRLYQPLSLHGTDGAGEEEADHMVLQAAVLERPMALAGAIPEDLVKAVGEPCRIASNSPAYTVEEANLLILSKIKMEVEMLEERLLVKLDVSELAMPEEVDLTARQALVLSIRAIRKTLEAYFAHSDEKVHWEVRITGTDESNASLRDLSAKYTLDE
ncbi:MAG: hypothetical protein O3A92_08810 [Verrucomicrobia bacterium]|nr:hypothetical protein [Verrucomicrobiota bacterium]